MIIEVDRKCGIPPERQIADAIAGRILTGQLRAGEEVPAIRDLAVQLQVNPRLVEQAYALVTGVGLVTPREDRAGWTVVPPPGGLTEFRADLVERLLQRALSRAQALDVPRAAVEDRFRRLLEEHYGRE